MLAAEKRFALHGYDAVSIRQIADEADVPLALVGYYFRPRQALFRTIFAAWSHTIDERLAALRVAAIKPLRAGRLKLILQAFVEPVLRMRASPEGEFYALLV
ncbi:MAG: helix-turn-helix domain-containing protein, partial [Burkholderiales bacterium]